MQVSTLYYIDEREKVSKKFAIYFFMSTIFAILVSVR